MAQQSQQAEPHKIVRNNYANNAVANALQAAFIALTSEGGPWSSENQVGAKETAEQLLGGEVDFSSLFNAINSRIQALKDALDFDKGIDPNTNTTFRSAHSLVQRSDPLALDLDEDGIETISDNSGITFDFDGDGLKTGTGWVKGDDGFLVLDRNGNSTIDSGKELFGVDTVKTNGQLASDGFDALRDLDGNTDGVFDAQDEQFANVRVWQDKNQDGIAQTNELKSLAEHNITAINLGSTATNQNSNGNLISAVGTFVRGDGSEGAINGNQSLAANLDLATNPFYREYTDRIELSDSVRALPDMKGSGAVRDLREAAMLDAGLKSVLDQYSQAQSREQQMGLLDKLLAEWASSSPFKTWDQRIGNLGDDLLEVSFAYSWERAETDGFGVGGGGSSGSVNLAETDGAAANSGPTGAQLAQKQLLERIKVLEVFNAQNFFNFSRSTTSGGSNGDAINRLTLASGAATGTRSLGFGVREVVLTEQDLNINAGQAALLNQSYDSLLASVYKGLVFQTQLKPYLDIVRIEFTETGVALDLAASQQLFQQNVQQNPVETLLDLADFLNYMKFSGNDMLDWGDFTDSMFNALSETDAVEFQRQLALLPHTTGEVRFGTQGVDNLRGGVEADIFFAGSGNDIIDGGAGSNTLYGGAGNDTLLVHASSNGNVLAGGTGNDALIGSGYADTYVFNLGDGVDTITESVISGSTVVYTDVLRFGEGIAASDIQTQRQGQDLVFAHSNGVDKVIVKNAFNTSGSSATHIAGSMIEKFEFADGTVWTWAEMTANGLVQTGTDGADSINGWAGKDIIHGGAGNDIIDGGAGSNTLYGGAGNDTLLVHASSNGNVLAGGTGNDALIGSGYADTYVFNLGDGVDTITDSGGNDLLLFGLSPDQLWFQRNGNNLDVLVEGTSDRVTVSNWYSNGASRIESLQSSGGLALTAARVQTLVDAMASFGVPAGGESNLTADQRAQLDVVIAANWQ